MSLSKIITPIIFDIETESLLTSLCSYTSLVVHNYAHSSATCPPSENLGRIAGPRTKKLGANFGILAVKCL